ncbi:hypothetical protein GPECTOR_3g509 [Gonium pectorale]|uniref:Uncharacterized protein n=1 Tax=Gonium pectorale TaxID=33097 RepID=A0A150H077_GONPE|nr:hypothetical protein GPECTOR_3g509 [Gonium pectorale]|eukprot:KXZ55382.1 hypothetical protein GPECTOR_3g509 [Gonium pectorale]
MLINCLAIIACSKFHDITMFDGSRRTCNEKLERTRQARSDKRRQQSEQARRALLKVQARRAGAHGGPGTKRPHDELYGLYGEGDDDDDDQDYELGFLAWQRAAAMAAAANAAAAAGGGAAGARYVVSEAGYEGGTSGVVGRCSLSGWEDSRPPPQMLRVDSVSSQSGGSVLGQGGGSCGGGATGPIGPPSRLSLPGGVVAAAAAAAAAARYEQGAAGSRAGLGPGAKLVTAPAWGGGSEPGCVPGGLVASVSAPGAVPESAVAAAAQLLRQCSVSVGGEAAPLHAPRRPAEQLGAVMEVLRSVVRSGGPGAPAAASALLRAAEEAELLAEAADYRRAQHVALAASSSALGGSTPGSGSAVRNSGAGPAASHSPPAPAAVATAAAGGGGSPAANLGEQQVLQRLLEGLMAQASGRDSPRLSAAMRTPRSDPGEAPGFTFSTRPSAELSLTVSGGAPSPSLLAAATEASLAARLSGELRMAGSLLPSASSAAAVLASVGSATKPAPAEPHLEPLPSGGGSRAAELLARCLLATSASGGSTNGAAGGVPGAPPDSRAASGSGGAAPGPYQHGRCMPVLDLAAAAEEHLPAPLPAAPSMPAPDSSPRQALAAGDAAAAIALKQLLMQLPRQTRNWEAPAPPPPLPKADLPVRVDAAGRHMAAAAAAALAEPSGLQSRASASLPRPLSQSAAPPNSPRLAHAAGLLPQGGSHQSPLMALLGQLAAHESTTAREEAGRRSPVRPNAPQAPKAAPLADALGGTTRGTVGGGVATAAGSRVTPKALRALSDPGRRLEEGGDEEEGVEEDEEGAGAWRRDGTAGARRGCAAVATEAGDAHDRIQLAHLQALQERLQQLGVRIVLQAPQSASGFVNST